MVGVCTWECTIAGAGEVIGEASGVGGEFYMVVTGCGRGGGVGGVLASV